MTRGPWTLSLADAEGTTVRLSHRKNYVPDVHEWHDLIQLARLIRRAEKWQRAKKP